VQIKYNIYINEIQEQIIKIIYWEPDTYKKVYGRESQHDLMVGYVVYDEGSEGKIYVTRANMNVIKFEQEHIGKVMTQKDFDDYKDLINEVVEVDRSYEED